ncbi:MAG: hypothetical protein WD355_08920 [Balneolaceae bacterium]
MNRLTQHKLFGVVGIFFVLFTTGCNESFEPWQENDRYHFSIYGYLDASADTQWVRVMPVREDLLYEPGPIDAVVTLEHLESGETVVMNDSLLSYAHGTYAWNFWTTMNIQPEQTYRLTAERSDGKTSSAEATLPADFPTPYIQIEYADFRRTPVTTTIFIENVDRLVDAQTVYRTYDNSAILTVPHLKDTVYIDFSNEYRIIMETLEDRNLLEVYFPVPFRLPISQLGEISDGIFLVGDFHKQIFLAAGGPDYHHFPSFDPKIEALPEGLSNVENGVGYLAGVVSKTIPYRMCRNIGHPIPIPCEEMPPPW